MMIRELFEVPAAGPPVSMRVGLLVVLVAAFCSPAHAQPVRVGVEVPFAAESPHPYLTGAGPAPSWSVVVEQPGATYIAVHFDRFELGPGDRIVVRSEDGGQRYVFTGRGKGERGAFWATHIQGDRAIVELLSPAPHPRAWGVSIDKFAAGTVDFGDGSAGAPESICSMDDRLNAICFETSEPEVYLHSQAVARLLIQGFFVCTGWLVGCQGHLMTNNHCIDDPLLGTTPSVAVENTDFEFRAEAPDCSDPNDVTLGFPGKIWPETATLVQRSVSSDYALIFLPDRPQDTYGALLLEDRLPAQDERIYFPQHPGGRGKEVGFFSDAVEDQSGFCEVFDPTGSQCSFPDEPTNVNYFCESEGGSSGSPILSYSTHNVVALHHCGGCPNSGLPIPEIIADLGPNLPACAVAGGPPELIVDRVTVDDSIGNMNGFVDPFEIPALRIGLRNSGSGMATFVSGILSTATPGIIVRKAAATWPNILASDTQTSNAPHFEIGVDEGVPCGTIVDFDLAVTTANGPFDLPFQLPIGEDLTPSTETASADTPLSIPDDTISGVDSTIFISDVFNMSDVIVSINISHAAIGDLAVELTSPLGTTVRLHDRTGDGTDNLATTYDSLTAPDGPGTMADFDGEPASGTWTLHVVDQGAGNTGAINSWSLRLLGPPQFACSPVPCFTMPQASANPDPVCDGDPTTLDASASTEFGQDCSGVLQYRFEIGGQLLRDWSTDPTAVVVPPASTVYTAKVRDVVNLDPGSAFPSVTVLSVPTASVVQLPDQACVEQDAVDLDAGPGFNSYAWRDDAGVPVGTSQILSLGAAACGRSYTVEVDNGTGCTDTAAHVVSCVTCRPPEVSPVGSPVPFRFGIDAASTVEFELLPDGDVLYHLYQAATVAEILAGDWTNKYCDLENGTLGAFNAVDATTARWTPIIPGILFDGYWVVVAERRGVEGPVGFSSGGPRPADADGAGSANSFGCP